MTYKLTQTLVLACPIILGNWISGSATTGWTQPPPPQYRIYHLSSTGCLPYRNILHRQGQASHIRFTHANDTPKKYPPDDRIRTKSEKISEQVVKTTGISLITNIPKVYAIPIQRNPRTSLNEGTQRHTAQGIRNGTAIGVSDGSFKYRCGNSAIVIEWGRNNLHRITANRTTPGRSEDQEEYRSKLSGIYHIMLTVEDICSK